MRKAIVGIFAFCVVTQVVLAFYRGRVLTIPPYVGLGVAVLFALPILFELGHEKRIVRVVAGTFGGLFVALGCATVLFSHPVGGLFRNVSVSLFLLSSGALLLTPGSRSRWRILCLCVFLLSFAGLQTIATVEAQHARQQREAGILAVWY